MKKKEGSTIIGVTVIFSITLMMVLITFALSINIIQNQSETVSDDIVCSELAAFKHIDKLELGGSEKIDRLIINEHEKAFDTFKDYLKTNLGLDYSFYPISDYNFIKGKVDIIAFKIYNVDGNDVEIITYSDSNPEKTTEIKRGGNGVVVTPKGNIVNHTTINAEIGFHIKPMFLDEKYVTKMEETDILVEGEED